MPPVSDLVRLVSLVMSLVTPVTPRTHFSLDHMQSISQSVSRSCSLSALWNTLFLDQRASPQLLTDYLVCDEIQCDLPVE